MIANLMSLLAFACVVHASVIINVFDGGDIRVKSLQSLSDCKPSDCDRFCRSAGFNKGQCVGNRCRCTLYPTLSADEDLKTPHTLSGCNPSDCDRFCRSAGFNKGECVGNRCRCTLYPTLSEQNAGYSDLDSCNYQGCDQLCRRLGFPGGACVGDRCVCDNFEPMIIKGKALNHLLHLKAVTKTPHSLDDCNFQACDQLCRNLGFPGGACVGDRCDCDNFRNDDNKEKKENDEKEALTAAGLGSCDIVNCDDMCHRLNYAGGTCIGGSCNCY